MNGFAFADDGPRGAVVIRNIIMMNRDEAEGHISEGALHSFVGTFSLFEDVCALWISSHTDSIKFGLDWKDTYVVMNTASESSCPNNAMQLSTLIR